MNKIFEEFGIQIKKKDFRVKSKEATILFEGEQNKIDLSRYFFYRDGEKIVNHTRFKLIGNLQQKDISKLITKAFYKQYKNCGIKKIELHADDKIGGWAWARYGFSISSKEEVKKLVSLNASPKNKPLMEAIIDDYYKNEAKNDNAPFPMNKLAEHPEFKEDIISFDWWGFLDLTDKKQVKVFENYLDSK
ncbi:MAG: hypothetical protein IKQ46_06505 [Bacteroidales bacterium]|nr:hypothetical protein [Bacteroidales bacterium]